MINICRCESGLRADAHNYNSRTHDDSWGVCQVNLYGELKNSRPGPEELIDPAKNIAFSFELFKKQGYNAWHNCNRKTLAK
jgi:hypothetical protein